MKVAILGTFGYGTLEESFASGFESLGASIHRCNVPHLNHRAFLPARVTKSVEEVQQLRPDVLLVIKGLRLPTRAIVKLKRAAGAIVCFNPDSPWEKVNSSDEILASIPLYDAHFTWGKSLFDNFYQYGARTVFYLAFAYDPALHPSHLQSDLPAQLPSHDAVFMGSYDRDRDAILGELSRTHSILICGNGWEKAKRLKKAHVHSRAIYGPESVRFMRKGRGVINLLRTQNLGSHNMKTFEIPASGSLMITQRSLEQEAFFPEGKASLAFGTLDELRHCLEVAKSDKEMAPIASYGQMLASNQTYSSRAQAVLEYLNLV